MRADIDRVRRLEAKIAERLAAQRESDAKARKDDEGKP